ncbi:MAG: PadR family transcriptional regulator [Longimicrobiales bacterium]|nr:PadR family transcriptional regulator [Longimicrobiales bacterium]
MSGSDLFTGTLDLLILRTLGCGPLHGYAIGRVIRETSAGVLDVEEGALYPALHRLERRGLLASEWGRTDTNRRAKFYAVTGAGAAHLESESTRWRDFSRAVHAVLEGGAEASG